MARHYHYYDKGTHSNMTDQASRYIGRSSDVEESRNPAGGGLSILRLVWASGRGQAAFLLRISCTEACRRTWSKVLDTVQLCGL